MPVLDVLDWTRHDGAEQVSGKAKYYTVDGKLKEEPFPSRIILIRVCCGLAEILLSRKTSPSSKTSQR